MNSSKDNRSSSQIRRLPWFFSIRVLLLVLVFAGAVSTSARAQKPQIAVFSGPTATIQNSQALVTSNKAREKFGLPLLSNPDGTPLRFDALRPQRLAAPVTVYVEAMSAHPLEQDMVELYAPPDGYLDAETSAFSKDRQKPGDIPVYEVNLRPEDGVVVPPPLDGSSSRWTSLERTLCFPGGTY